MKKIYIVLFALFFIMLVILGVKSYKDKQVEKSLSSENSMVDTKTSTDVTVTENKEEDIKKPLEVKQEVKKYMNDSDVKTLDVKITQAGQGEAVTQKGNVLSMNYTGTLLNGKKFDSNVDPAFGHVEPFNFQIGAGMVIRGWDEGLIGMKKGEKRILTIPADMAYGARGAGAVIPPNAALIFEVELLDFK